MLRCLDSQLGTSTELLLNIMARLKALHYPLTNQHHDHKMASTTYETGKMRVLGTVSEMHK